MNYNSKFLSALLFISLFWVATAVAGENSLGVAILIDNSGSMDWEGHDPKKLRWEATKLAIDKTREGDWLSLIDFSDRPRALVPSTKIDGNRSQRDDLKRKSTRILSNRQLTDIERALKMGLAQLEILPLEIENRAVILLTDGEVDIVEGDQTRKKAAARMSKANILSQTVPQFIEREIQIYVVALTDEPDKDFLGKLAEYTALPDREKELHFFSSPSSTDLVKIFSEIFNQLRRVSVQTTDYEVTGQKVQEIPLEDPFAEKAEFQFVHDPESKPEINLRNPSGSTVPPAADERSYKLFNVDAPIPGVWKAEINADKPTPISQTVAIEEDVRINLPFSPKFRVGTPLNIVANVFYNDELIDADHFITTDGKKFQIEELWCKVIDPNGVENGPYLMENSFGDYTHSYGDATAPGSYLVQIELYGTLDGQRTVIKSEKRAIGVVDKYQPRVKLNNLPKSARKGQPLKIEALVTDNAESMTAQYLSVIVNYSDKTNPIQLYRVKRDTYAAEYVPAVDGEYEFKLTTNGTFIVSGDAQKVMVIAGSGAFRIYLPIVVAVLFLAGSVFAVIRFRIPAMISDFVAAKLEQMKKSRVEKVVEEPEEPEEPEETEEEDLGVSMMEISQGVDTFRDIPSEIELIRSGESLTRVALAKKKDAISGEMFYTINVQSGILTYNGREILSGESVKAKAGDTLEVGPVIMRIPPEEGKVEIVSNVDTMAGLLEEDQGKERLKWTIRIEGEDDGESDGNS